VIFQRLLAFFFQLLYHQLAWMYDLVAWCVSLGAWKKWVQSMTQLIHGSKVLELGFGPGHLQSALLQNGFYTFGIDESMQMAGIARQRLRLMGNTSPTIVRSLGESLPFVNGSFDTVISTFPPPYIFKQETISEIFRVLNSNGEIIILLAADMPGNNVLARLIRWIMRITGQLPPSDFSFDQIIRPFEQEGFLARAAWTSRKEGSLLILTGHKFA
jgi:ubiquinone/menaquinone biosynthesis C-methylase UbiE